MLPLPLGIGAQEVGIVALLLLVLFGSRKLPEIGRSLAQGIGEFKKASREVREEDAKPSDKNTEAED